MPDHGPEFAETPGETLAGRIEARWLRGDPPGLDEIPGDAGPRSPVDLAAALGLDQWHRWHAGQRVPVEDYLARHPAVAADAESEFYLAYGEFLVREELEEVPDFDDYVRRFPRHAAALRRQFELRLLVANEELGSTVGRPAQSVRPADDVQISESVGARIGPYRLMEKLGEGGFGLVFVAEQTEPLRRKVALKIIKPGMDSKQVIARFEAERQALALMDHPNIARVLDAGATEAGRPYFVMELVRGVPITDYCDKNRLAPKERLELFVTVCHAIQHAHQKGIIHRDVKPSNVLVTSHDGRPVAKVIDFGVAKAINQQLTAHTIYTNFAQMIGTPLYMSPEQAEMSGLDIDTRSDVYSLGVLLYELLTGTTPLETKRFAKAAYDEIRRLIREEEPPKPSTRLSSSDSTIAIAAQRQMEPAKLSKLVRGDLDWIAMKSLEKDRTRRYETADGLARDIQRYLSDEPVEACPPSAAYRLRKFARKNRAALTTAALVALFLITGLALSVWQAVRAIRAESAALASAEAERNANADAVESARREAEERKKADGARAEAEAKEAEANAVVKFFEDKVFAAGRPKGEGGGLGHDVSLRDAILASLPALTTSLMGQPIVEARLRRTLGLTFFHLGQYAQATEQFERARVLWARHRGSDHADTLATMTELACGYDGLNRPTEALKLREETLAAQKRVLPSDHFDTIVTMHNLANSYLDQNLPAKALKLYEETLEAEKRVLGSDNPVTLLTMLNVGTAYVAMNRNAEGLKLNEETLAAQKRVLCPDHPDMLRAMHGLAHNYAAMNRHGEAIKLYEETLAARKRVLPPDHPETLRSMHNLALSYEALKRYGDALKLNQETLAARKRVLGPDDVATLWSMHNLACSYAAMNRHAEAIKLHEEALAARKRVLPPDHPDTLTSMYALATSYAAMNRHGDAIKLYEEVLAARKRVLPPDHPDTLTSMYALAVSYAALNRHADAIKLYEEVLAARKRVLSPDHPDTLQSMHGLALSYEALNCHGDAVRLNEETLAARKRVLGPDDAGTLWSMNNLANCYVATNRQAEARKLREEVLAARKRALPADHVDTLASMYAVAYSHAAMNRHVEACKSFEELLAAQKRVLPPDHVDTLQSMHLLAYSFTAINRHSDALKLNEETLAARKRVLTPDHPDTLHSMHNLALSYAEMKRYAEACKLYEETLAARKRVLCSDHSDTLATMHNLADVYAEMNRHGDAIKLNEETLAARKRVLGPDDVGTLWSMRNLAFSYAAVSRDAEALALIQEALAKADRPEVDLELFAAAIRLRLQCYRKLGDLAGCRLSCELLGKRELKDAPPLYDAACCRAATASLQAKAKEPDAARLARDDADKAMAWLTKAVAAGWKDVDYMKKDADLDFLRERQDFKRLVAALEKNRM